MDTMILRLATCSRIIYRISQRICCSSCRDLCCGINNNKYEKDWSIFYRKGADGSNMAVTGSSSANESATLKLLLQPTRADHLVVGGSVSTVRRDTHYGSSRSLMRSPARWVGGSVLFLSLWYNRTQTVTLNIQNANTPSTASVSMLEREEFPDSDLGIPYR